MTVAQLPQLHAERIERAFGDFYGLCQCGARSLPCAFRLDAERWKCPIGEGEATAAYAMQRWNERVLTATTHGYLRS